MTVYHYYAFCGNEESGTRNHIDGILTTEKPIATIEGYSEIKQLLVDKFNCPKLVVVSLSVLQHNTPAIPSEEEIDAAASAYADENLEPYAPTGCVQSAFVAGVTYLRNKLEIK